MYLPTVIDVYSRHVLSWSISNIMDAQRCRSIVRSAVQHGKPEIIYKNQGRQFTIDDFVILITNEYKIKFSMDSKGRARQHIHRTAVEQFQI